MILDADNNFSNERIRTATTSATTNRLSMDDADYVIDFNLKTLHCLMLEIESSLCEVILVDCHSSLNLILTTKQFLWIIDDGHYLRCLAPKH